jgi:hypothetical protein
MQSVEMNISLIEIELRIFFNIKLIPMSSLWANTQLTPSNPTIIPINTNLTPINTSSPSGIYF